MTPCPRACDAEVVLILQLPAGRAKLPSLEQLLGSHARHEIVTLVARLRAPLPGRGRQPDVGLRKVHAPGLSVEEKLGQAGLGRKIPLPGRGAKPLIP